MSKTAIRHSRAGTPTALAIMLILTAIGLGGCQLVGFFAAAYEKETPKSVRAEYRGLEGKSFAVVIAADRVIQADYPGVVPTLTVRISETLAEHAGASGYAQPELLLARLYERPGWVAMPLGELAEYLGVERLIYIDLYEFRLNDPGNRYLWSGVAAGRLSVIEVDSAIPDEPVFEKSIRVTYPDSDGYGEGEMTGSQVGTVLVIRFAERAAWTFYDHKERRDLPY